MLRIKPIILFKRSIEDFRYLIELSLFLTEEFVSPDARE